MEVYEHIYQCQTFLFAFLIAVLCLVRVQSLPASREGLYDGFYDGHAETDDLRARRRLHDRLRRLAVHTSEKNRVDLPCKG